MIKVAASTLDKPMFFGPDSATWKELKPDVPPGINKPIGVAEYQLVRSLPEPLDTRLPTIEEIEAELAGDLLPPTPAKTRKPMNPPTALPN